MTDYFKTIRAYMRGKWGRKSAPNDVRSELILDANGHITGFRASARGYQTMRLTNPMWSEILEPVKANALREEIARLRRNKKKHSHLQKQLDDLLNGGADNADTKMEGLK